MESHDHLFKVLIIGDCRVGKTSLVHRYVHEKFFKSYKSTVGVDFALKALTWSDTETVRLQLWDIADLLPAPKNLAHSRSGMFTYNSHHLSHLKTTGKSRSQERVTSLTRIYYKGASGCVLMFDVTSISSFHSCQKWKEDLDSKALLVDGSPIPCILLANKCDLSPWQVSKKDVETFSKTSGFIAWMEISVKDNRNITESMRILAENMMATQAAFGEPENQGNSLKLSSAVTTKEATGDQCCSTVRNLVE